MAKMPAATVVVSTAVVRSLLVQQRPDLAHLHLKAVSNGWDNAIFRLGTELAVRLPRRPEAVPLILHEQLYLPDVAERSPTPVPAPVHAGRPSPNFPWPWSIVRWIEGTPAVDIDPADRREAAEDLASFVASVNIPAPADAPINPFRGVPLRARSTTVLERLADGRRYPQAADLAAMWAMALDAPDWSGPPLWIHGDLHPANVLLSSDGSLAGVVDFGDIGAGDPAVDLAVAWLMFDDGGRQRFIAAFDGSVDGMTWVRARGWAVALSAAMLSNSDDNPQMFSVGEFGLRQVLSG